MRPISSLLVVAAAALVPGCLPLLAANAPPPHGLTGGERLHVARDSLLLEMIGPGPRAEDHRVSGFGFQRVVPAGAEVQVTADYVAQRAAAAPDAPLIDRNPWIYVEVIESPVDGQRGWRGWVHLSTTGAALPTAPPLSDAVVTRATRLCPSADSVEQACTIALPATTPVRRLGCDGRRVLVELWAGDGHYAHGYVSSTQLDHPTCDAVKE